VRRRRKTKYTWLPVFGTDMGVTGAPDDVAAGLQLFHTALETGETTVDITPLTVDQPREGTDLLATDPLGTVIGNEYILRRIVGKFHASIIPKRNANNDPSVHSNVCIAAGFFVARAGDTAQNADQPIGSASISERRTNYSPLSQDTCREPWIWRRTWILTNPAHRIMGSTALGTAFPSSPTMPIGFPESTEGYGSVADGPHIDAKTVRRIRQDERLWFAVATCSFPLGQTSDQSVGVISYLDFRLLGALRRARNSGAF